MSSDASRREFLALGATAFAAATTFASADAPAPAAASAKHRYQNGLSPWPLALNASTIRPTPVADKIRVAAEAGWDAVELWMDDLEAWEKDGKKLADLGKEIKDRGMFVNNVIGLWDGMPATQEAWDAQLPATRERLRLVSEVGAQHVAVLPFPDIEDYNLTWMTARYKELFNIARADYNVVAAMEYIGFTKSINTPGKASAIAMDADEAGACVIWDTFHLCRGGAGFNSIKHVQPQFIADFHWNDLPAGDCTTMGDADRIYPGDGVLPLVQALKDLHKIGYKNCLSLELFNRAHWEMDPKEVAQTGLRKMQENITAALA